MAQARKCPKADQCGVDCAQSASAKADLSGRCILFVGGRKQNLPYFRRYVEECNGVFAYHDGGMEENMSRLESLFSRADAVVFPVDCISHAAQNAVKKLCRRWEKPFMPIRRSGISAFVQALDGYVAEGRGA